MTTTTTTPQRSSTEAGSTTSTKAETEPDVVCTRRAVDEVYLEDVGELPDPADDLAENLPAGSEYFAWSTRDGPASDFAPCYHLAGDSFFDDDSIVIGVEIDGEARAFIPDQLIAHVVNDHIGTTPLLVSY